MRSGRPWQAAGTHRWWRALVRDVRAGAGAVAGALFGLLLEAAALLLGAGLAGLHVLPNLAALLLTLLVSEVDTDRLPGTLRTCRRYERADLFWAATGARPIRSDR